MNAWWKKYPWLGWALVLGGAVCLGLGLAYGFLWWLGCLQGWRPTFDCPWHFVLAIVLAPILLGITVQWWDSLKEGGSKAKEWLFEWETKRWPQLKRILSRILNFLKTTWTNWNLKEAVIFFLIAFIGAGFAVGFIWSIGCIQCTSFPLKLKKDCPWNLALAVFSGPVLLRVWLIRFRHKEAEIKNARTLNRTESRKETQRAFEQLQEWVGKKENPILQASAIYQMRDFIQDKYRVRTLSILRSFLDDRYYQQEAARGTEPVSTSVLQEIGDLLCELPRGARDLGGWNLQKLNLQGIDMSFANLQKSNLKDTKLQSANLHRASLQEANLQSANLQEANLQEAELQEANLQSANLQEANLQGANLQKAELQEANLQSANLQEANLQKSDLLEADLQDAKLQGADLPEANLEGAKLQGADLRDANLQETNLQGAYLQGADLRDADLQEANLQGADLEGAKLRGAKLRRAKIEKKWEDKIKESEVESKPDYV